MRAIVLLGLLSLFAFAALGCGQGAFAQSNTASIGLIARAQKAFEASEYSNASALIEQAFKLGLAGDLAARAILLRAEINEKNGQLARALQDYSNALWMESLPPAERKTAQGGKERVMAAMGLNASSPSARSPSSGSTQAAASAPASSNGLFGIFGGLFSSGDPKPSTQTQAGPQPVAADAKPAPTQAATAKPKVAAVVAPKPQVAASPPSTASIKKPAPMATAASIGPVAASPSAGGAFIVFGSAASQAAGAARAQQIKAQLADILVNRDLTVEALPAGSLQIVAGPYKVKSAAVSICNAIKQRGVPCQVSP